MGYCIVKIQFPFSFSGASPPDPLTRGSAPGLRWGLCHQTPDIGSRSALAVSSPHCLEEIAATGLGSCPPPAVTSLVVYRLTVDAVILINILCNLIWSVCEYVCAL